MQKKFLFAFLFILAATAFPAELYAQYDQSFRFYMDMAKAAIKEKNYKSAYIHLQTAQAIYPASEEPLKYVNYVRRLEAGQVSALGPETLSAESEYLSPEELPEKSTPGLEPLPPVLPIVIERVKFKTRPAKAVPFEKTPTAKFVPSQSVPVVPPKKETARVAPTLPAKVPVAKSATRTKPDGIPSSAIKPTATKKTLTKTIYLNDEFWQQQPDTLLQIEIGNVVILEGDNIQRFLVVTPGPIDVQQPNARQLVLVAQKRGTTFFHIWQGDRRWTFRINTIFPLAFSHEAKVMTPQYEEYAKPFEFLYNSDWNSYYRGKSMRTLGRQSLNYRQWMGVFGDTPYGKFDSSVNFYMFKESTEATGYTVGLTKGQVGDFKDFSIRGYDASKHFSDLSLPGRYFRGVLFESPAFNNKLTYVLLHGQDLAIYDYFTPGETILRRSYIEAAKVTFTPDEDQMYSINYARGWGELRPQEFKDKVYSVEAKRILDKTTLYSEVAYDETNLGYNLRGEHKADDWSLSVKFRDIEKDFYTISGSPSGQGQIGGLTSWQWISETLSLDAFLDIYRDRLILNPDRPNAVNVDFNTNALIKLDDDASWRTSVYFTDTPGLVTTRREARMGNTFLNSQEIWGGKFFSYFVGHNIQYSRSSTTPSAGYDRNSLTTGFRLPLIGRLSYFLNYEYSWVTDVVTHEASQPSVMNTGFNYTQKITGSLFGNLGFIFRDEENAQGAKSFLAGEDSISGSVGLTYQPTRDFQIFMDGSMRNVWAENPTVESYTEADLRFGLKSKWGMPVSWSPSGLICGTIFKDGNGNGILEKGEAGIPRVKVRVGKEIVTTNKQGYFKRGVRAKKVLVTVEMESLPEGYVFSRHMTKEIYIEQGKTYQVDFGLTINSGIYGVVYYDKNKNNKIDPDDVFIPRVKVTLDAKETVYTDGEGSYTFGNIQPGEHHLDVDLNTIPMEYLPLVKLDQMVNVSEGTTYIFHIPLKKKNGSPGN